MMERARRAHHLTIQALDVRRVRGGRTLLRHQRAARMVRHVSEAVTVLVGAVVAGLMFVAFGAPPWLATAFAVAAFVPVATAGRRRVVERVVERRERLAA